jgi:hypothetical protein
MKKIILFYRKATSIFIPIAATLFFVSYTNSGLQASAMESVNGVLITVEQEIDTVLQNKTPEEIARFFFESCRNADWENVKKVYPFNLEYLRRNYVNLEIIEIGIPLERSDIGFYVPYKIKLKSGKIRQHKLAIRNDNPQNMWEIDGGIL